MAEVIRVKRNGPRGWHLIAKNSYDPKVYEIVKGDPLDHDADGKKGGSLPEPPATEPEPAKPAPPKRAPARKRKAKR